ncbi:FAD-dependent oxidoreductase [Actinomadura sp. ATCC 31491]|uniref:FAD-dependent oxidoreductase n=1 Tax=Actinomadura luzonensis TaxID=2805427 RepID=A0ABT0FU90_9ACTN|nr:FAD-dependent oxidoreductase [Actinomadura luzonensis]MCK2215900.1 FAD-dependent oxidoreductase [Actinomadura luzonensis]
MNAKYDVVVVGGGAAGLSGALTLGRARRKVLVVDAGRPRNAPAQGVHAFLTREGTPPHELLATGREEVAGYGGEIVTGTVVAAERLGGEDPGPFRVTLADGSAVVAERLLLATGLVDELPDVPGLAERWGRDVLHCPYCHGWEVRDRPIAVLSTGPLGVHQALLWRQWSDRVTFVLHDGPRPDEEQREKLAARGVRVVEERVSGLEITGDRLTGVRLAGGEVVACEALAVGTRMNARADLLPGLGLETEELVMAGHVIGTHVPADATGATRVPGVWVAGNAASVADQVIAAAAGAVRAAAAINADLIEQESRRAVAAHRAAAGHQDEPLGSGRSPQHDVHQHDSGGHGGRGGHGGGGRSEGPGSAGDGDGDAEGHGHGGQGHGHGHGQGAFEVPEGMSAEEFWNGRYGEQTRIWSGNPNLALVREVTGLAPGRALDLGCGEGADAIWLAARGWRVTAADISQVALDRAAEEAVRAGVAGLVEWQRHDLAESFPAGSYDLVSASYLHSPVELPREEILRAAAAAVVPGGVLLITGHLGWPSWMQDEPPVETAFPTPGDVLDAVKLGEPEWEVLTCEEFTRERPAPDGTPGTHVDYVIKARRRP